MNELLWKGRPNISKDQDTVTAILGQDFEIACPAQGIPKPVITWSFEGFPIDTQGSKFKVKLSGSLVVKKIGELDTGLYTCTAVNTAGSDSHTYALFIHGKPLNLENYVWSSSILNYQYRMVLTKIQ